MQCLKFYLFSKISVSSWNEIECWFSMNLDVAAQINRMHVGISEITAAVEWYNELLLQKSYYIIHWKNIYFW